MDAVLERLSRYKEGLGAWQNLREDADQAGRKLIHSTQHKMGCSQVQLAGLVNMSQFHLCRVLRGQEKVSVKLLARLTDVVREYENRGVAAGDQSGAGDAGSGSGELGREEGSGAGGLVEPRPGSGSVGTAEPGGERQDVPVPPKTTSGLDGRAVETARETSGSDGEEDEEEREEDEGDDSPSRSGGVAGEDT